jgi:hypothetical protein
MDGMGRFSADRLEQGEVIMRNLIYALAHATAWDLAELLATALYVLAIVMIAALVSGTI